MEVSTTIAGMIRGNQIVVPDYQRAYSWEKGRQVSVFLDDLEDYLKSSVATPYYFGHFLYEKTGEATYAVIDGQQRLTTIVIFLCTLFNRIRECREFSDEEQDLYEDIIKRRSTYKFSTVKYDNQLFKDYVIDQTKKDRYGIDTTSGSRIADAYDYFSGKVKDMELSHVKQLLHATAKASCTTHIVNNEAEAIQMFIFQNDRGKKPSHLEVIKAQFMYQIHIYGGEETDSLIEEVKNRFEHIYRSISEVEDFVEEDAVLLHTLKVYFNSLWESTPTERVNEEISKPTRLQFIKDFSLALERSFNNLARLNSDRNNDVNIEAALACGRYEIVLPFFIKAYTKGIPLSEISRMGKALGDLMLRDRIVKTRADLRSRLNDVFQQMETSVDDVVGRIIWMKEVGDRWWAYWNNNVLQLAVEANWHRNDHGIAKIILWKYENHLISSEGKSGYAPISYRSILKPHLEHIAPQTENGEKEAAGYDTYDDDFRENYLLRLGNFLLLSAPHNESIGNKPFELKRSTYDQLRQQREIQIMTETDRVWNKAKISERQRKIVDFILNNL